MKINLFRGKRVYDDKWLVGYYVLVEDFESKEDAPVIIPREADLYSYGEIDQFDFVDPITVGQYIGAIDADGDMIFEGDVVESLVHRVGHPGVRIIIRDIREARTLLLCSDQYKVIGNIHDNPELLYEHC